MKIVVRMPNWIGDFVLATAILEDLRLAYPQSHIAVVCPAILSELLEDNPHIDVLFLLKKGEKRWSRHLLQVLRKQKFDLGILLTNSLSTAICFWLGCVKIRVGFKRWIRSLFLNRAVPFPANKGRQHLIKTYKELLVFLGVDTSQGRPRLPLLFKKKSVGKILVGISPSSAYGEAKCWSLSRFREVISRLLSEVPGLEVVILGDASSTGRADEICFGLSSAARNLSGKTTIKELVQEISGLDVLLTNDSGPMHIAAALKIPLVALFGSTNPVVTGPYEYGKVIYKQPSCSPCYRRVCPIDFRCMQNISVEEVALEVKRALLVKPMEEIERKKPFSFRKASPPSYVLSVSKKDAPFGVILLAGGAGRRLGLSYPKGCFSVCGKSLYETLIEKAPYRCAIMTSSATHAETKRFLVAKGLNHVELFQQRSLPRLGSACEESPDGNGSLFSAFFTSPIWGKWADLEQICVLPIDNPLGEVLVGEGELTVAAVEKSNPDDDLGVLVHKEGRLHVCEYSELPVSEKERWSLGYSGIFSCSRAFFEKAAQLDLPWHLVKRGGASHVERFVFDAFPFAESYQVVLRERATYFSPIKTRENLALFK